MSIPNDPYLELQWHLQNNVTGMLDLNLIGVWSNTDATDVSSPTYSGAGTRLVLVSDGFDYNHHDISANYNTSLDYDFEFSRNDAFGSATDVTGTALAGLIAASANGRGTVGIAYDAELIGYRMSWPWGSEGIGSVAAVIERALSNAQADVTVFAQQSLGSAYDAGPAVVDPNIIAQIRERVDVALSSGRGGLGMTIVKSAGDSHYDPEWYNPPYNVNLDPWASDSRQIVVTGVDESGFTNDTSGAGTPILISAFSTDNYSYYSKLSNLFTTDRTGTAGQTSRDYVYDFGGTAAATAMVAGVVSLMYEANPGLGWRDVQAILAASARHVGSEVGTNFSNWQWNASTTWNNGGLHFSESYGFGLVDAWAAVRLAETWQLTDSAAAISTNEAKLSIDALNLPVRLLETGETDAITFTRNISTNIKIERVSVTLDMEMNNVGLKVYLVSPEGTTSELVSDSSWNSFDGTWRFDSQELRGETSPGQWSIRVEVDGYNLWGDLQENLVANINDVKIEIYGKSGVDDRYVFTNEFSDYAYDTSHLHYTDDQNGGIDTVNVSSVSSGSIIRLGAGESRIDGISTYFYGIENAIGGDFGDNMTGNDLANVFYGRRGNDSINGGPGNDGIYGAWGNDILNGGSGVDTVTGGSDNDTLIDDDLLNGDRLLGEAGIDTIDYSRVSFAAGTVTLNLTTGLATTTASSARDTISGFENALGSQGGETIRGTAVANVLTGNGGDDRLIGEAGNDVLTGGLGKDSLYGGAGVDRFVFASRSESPLGAACDVLTGYSSGPAFDGAGATVGDIIDLAGIDANETSAGNQTFAFSTAQTIGTLRCLEVSGVTRVLGFVNSTAGADFQIDIQDGGVLASQYTAADFVL